MRSYYEFFAGGGMVRAGLGEDWACLLANDIDPKKGDSYRANWGSDRLRIEDVAKLTLRDLPGQASLAWASFPCQDLSLAGNGAGLNGKRSGTFWPFWALIKELRAEGRAPKLIVIENVCGTLSSHGGRDFSALASAIVAQKYRLGALVIDAVHFVPQSRPRLFIVCVKEGIKIPDKTTATEANPFWHPPHLTSACEKLTPECTSSWIWWRLPLPPSRTISFSQLIENEPTGVNWHTQEETKYLLSLMSPLNRQKLWKAKKMGRRMVGGVYKRTRENEAGARVQRAEVRFDDIAGCLRTPVGGSSRQSIVIVEGQSVRSRLLSPREAARLMGLPDTYKLPDRYNDAYQVAGDGVVVPVVRFLAANLLEPLLSAVASHAKDAA